MKVGRCREDFLEFCTELIKLRVYGHGEKFFKDVGLVVMCG